MRLNPGKCKTMQVCFSRNPPPPPALNIDGHQLAVVSVARCLGVTFQADLKWDAHVKETTKKGNQRLYLLCRLRQFNPPVEDLLTTYTCFVRPVLEYAAPLWHPGLTKAQRRKIENIQRRATRIILAKEFTNYKSALETLQLQTLEDRRIALCRRFANNIQASSLYRHWLPQTRGSSVQNKTAELATVLDTYKPDIVAVTRSLKTRTYSEGETGHWDISSPQKPLRAENPYENVGYGGKWSPTGRTSSSSSEKVDILTTHLHLVKTPGDRETLQKSLRAENPYEKVHVGYAGKWSPPRRTRSSSSEKVAVLTTHLHLVKTSGDRETLQKPLRAENPYGNVRYGGKWSPPGRNRSSSSEKIAVLVTFRDREKHLDIFLRHMHPFLQRQGLDYTIYVIEQHGDEPTFCKGLLYNVGFTEALKEDPTYDCFIFHDVDLLPEDDRNLYTCSQSPYHLSVAVDTLNYSLPYQELFGGVSALKTWHYKLVNGYSNLFCGWGGEDDDMAIRLKLHLLKLSRPSKDVARYKMLRHNKTERNPQSVSRPNADLVPPEARPAAVMWPDRPANDGSWGRGARADLTNEQIVWARTSRCGEDGCSTSSCLCLRPGIYRNQTLDHSNLRRNTKGDKPSALSCSTVCFTCQSKPLMSEEVLSNPPLTFQKKSDDRTHFLWRAGRSRDVQVSPHNHDRCNDLCLSRQLVRRPGGSPRRLNPNPLYSP
ncbi:Beta-1,4-galactosyltransferase 3 [Branchiostoma belcheri]|nr:Beta-1,4-galactosyltransferase 3 [Branchiostoma belcheri]